MWYGGDHDVLGSQRFNLKVEGSMPGEYIEKEIILCEKRGGGVKGITDGRDSEWSEKKEMGM